MHRQINRGDLVAISFLIYSLYFGAGNLIFPIKVGYRVGVELLPAMVGFIAAAVALPALVLWACARADGGIEKVAEALPKPLAMAMAITLYMIIGPLLGLPRFAGVAYTTVRPLLGSGGQEYGLLVFSLVFFALTLFLAINRGRILDIVGKVMAPMLITVLLLIAFGAVFFPQGTVGGVDPFLPKQSTIGFFGYGLEEGYQTLNAIGSLVMGIVVLNSIHALGFDRKDVGNYMMQGVLFAGIGLAVTFAALSYLGATAHELAGLPQHEVTGAEITPVYAQALYGVWGMIALAIVVTLACMTTAIGLISACGSYFSTIIPAISYKAWAVGFTVLSIVVANMGLGPLLVTARPVLLGCYPIAITVALLSLVQHKMADRRFVFLFTLIPVIPLGIIEGLRTSGSNHLLSVQQFASALPLYEQGFGWLVPGLVFFAAGMVISEKRKQGK
jgi:LIVCS family branched-chain amino acid:cation transporter